MNTPVLWKHFRLSAVHEPIIFMVDTELKILWINQTAANLLDTSPPSLIGKSCHEVFAGSDDCCDDCLARQVARELGLQPQRVRGLWMAAAIHDIGKVAIPTEILVRPGKLSAMEMELVRSHPEVGYEIMQNVDFPWPVADIVRQHHERLDGSGYPWGLKGASIMEEARILGVVDVVEAMSSHRPYRPSRGIEAALEEIERNKGKLYDEAVVNACLRVFREKGFQFDEEEL